LPGRLHHPRNDTAAAKWFQTNQRDRRSSLEKTPPRRNLYNLLNHRRSFAAATLAPEGNSPRSHQTSERRKTFELKLIMPPAWKI
jgi:hypothetical protein